MKLSQTLAGNWVITVANPEEDGMETQLAEFSLDATGEGSTARDGIENAAAAAFAALVKAVNVYGNADISVTSHNTDARDAMRERCYHFGLNV